MQFCAEPKKHKRKGSALAGLFHQHTGEALVLEVKGSYEGLIYIAIYRRDGSRVSWSASIEDEEGAVIFVADHFVCREENEACELLLRQKMYGRIDAYHASRKSPTSH